MFFWDHVKGINIECAICGEETKKLYRVEVEGAILEACERCLRYGKNLGEVETIPIKKKIVTGPHKEELEEKEEIVLVDNYGKMIVEARKKRNLTREEFAKKIKEKESVIRRVESEEMEPDDALVEKIERFLEIKLKKSYEKTILGKKEIKGSLTLGDVVE